MKVTFTHEEIIALLCSLTESIHEAERDLSRFRCLGDEIESKYSEKVSLYKSLHEKVCNMDALEHCEDVS